MGLALGMFLIVGIISLFCLIYMIIRCIKVRKYWKKVWIYFFLYISGALVSFVILAFSIWIVLEICDYGMFF